MAWLSGWDQRIKIDIGDYAGDISAEVTWFPVTVFLTATQCEEVFVELTTDAEYKKVAFTKADGETELYADCELFDVSETKGIYHVSRDGWTINANTSIYMYYDKDHVNNTTYISLSGGTAAQSVWDGNFKAVYHMHNSSFATWSAMFNDWDTQYEAIVEPDSDGWVLGGTDYVSVAGGILTIDTTGDSTGECYYSKTPDVNFDDGFYYKIRTQIHSDTPVTGYLTNLIYDGTQNERTFLNIYDGKIAVRTSGGAYHETVMDTTSAYHIYEAYIKGTVVLVYVDGVLTDTQAVESASVVDKVLFGDTNTTVGFTLECMIDYIYYALGTDFDPSDADSDIIDSTSNNNNGTKKGATEPVEATGKIGQGQDFDGSDDYIDCGTDDTLKIAGNITLEVVAKLGASQLNRPMIARWDGDHSYLLTVDYVDDDKIRMSLRVSDSSKTAVSSSTYNDSAYHYFAGGWDGSNARLYIDEGAEDITGDATGGPIDTPADIKIALGSYSALNGEFDGIEDEVRISAIYRATAWKKGTYNSLWDTLLTYGSEETEEVTANSIFFGTNF